MRSELPSADTPKGRRKKAGEGGGGTGRGVKGVKICFVRELEDIKKRRRRVMGEMAVEDWIEVVKLAIHLEKKEKRKQSVDMLGNFKGGEGRGKGGYERMGM